MKYSIQKGRPLSFTQGMWWKDELVEFEYSARMQPLGDAEAYGHSLKDDEESDAVEDELDELEKELDAEEQLIEDQSGEDDHSGDSYE